MNLPPSYVSEEDLSLALYEVSIRSEESTLRILAYTPLRESISRASEDRNWWYRRTEYLVGRNLLPRIGDWKRVYTSLYQNGLIFNEGQDYSSTLLVQVLLEIGADPSENYDGLMRGLAQTASEEVLLLIFSEPRIDITAEEDIALYSACLYGNITMLKILLSYPEVDPSIDIDELLDQATERGYLDIIKLLMADPRVENVDINSRLIQAIDVEYTEVALYFLSLPGVDPSIEHNLPIRTAASNGDAELVRELLRDPRVDPTSQDNEALRRSIPMGYIEVVRILLEDRRINPANLRKEFERAVTSNRLEMIHLLLMDGRIDPHLTNSLGKTAKTGTIEMMKLLLADPTMSPEGEDNYVLRMVRKFKREDMEALLLRDQRVRILDEKMK